MLAQFELISMACVRFRRRGTPPKLAWVRVDSHEQTPRTSLAHGIRDNRDTASYCVLYAHTPTAIQEC